MKKLSMSVGLWFVKLRVWLQQGNVTMNWDRVKKGILLCISRWLRVTKTSVVTSKRPQRGPEMSFQCVSCWWFEQEEVWPMFEWFWTMLSRQGRTTVQDDGKCLKSHFPSCQQWQEWFGKKGFGVISESMCFVFRWLLVLMEGSSQGSNVSSAKGLDILPTSAQVKSWLMLSMLFGTEVSCPRMWEWTFNVAIKIECPNAKVCVTGN